MTSTELDLSSCAIVPLIRGRFSTQRGRFPPSAVTNLAARLVDQFKKGKHFSLYRTKGCANS